jgi:haloalkane dehalogenase
LPQLADRPALLCWATKDFAFHDSERKRWEELFPSHRTVLLEGAGHYLQEDAAPEIITSVREFASSAP